MFKRLILLSALSRLAFAQEDPDIPPQFRNLITPEQYHTLRDGHINLLRGMPADPSLRAQAIQQLLVKRAFALSGPIAPVTWRQLGPTPIPNGQTQGVVSSVSGRVTAIAIDPTNANFVYVGSAQGGVYRTLDGAATWTQIFDNNRTSAIGALAIDSANSRLYVGTGEANGSADSFAGVGLFRIDNVNSAAPAQVGPINPVRNYLDVSSVAQSVAVFTGRSIASIVLIPNDPTTLFVGVAGGVIGSGGDAPFGGSVPPLGLRGLYKLTNVTGDPAAVGVLRIGVRSGAGIEGCFDTPCTGNRNVNSIVLDPGDLTGNTLILWLNGTNAANDGGIWRTTNALAATPSFSQSFATTSTSTSNGRGHLSIYKEGANPAVVYAASGEPVVNNATTSCISTSQSGAMRVSTDGGITFGAKLFGSGGFCDGQCFYNIGMDVIPGATTAQNDDIILLGGNTRSTTNCQRLGARSTDGGATFTDPATSGLHADTHFIKIAPGNPNIVYHGNDGGVFKSIDGGQTWASVNPGFNTVQFSGLAIHPTDQNFTIGGTQDNGTNNLLANGTTWNRIDFGDGGYAMIDQNATDTSAVTMYHTYFNQTNSLLGFARVDTVAAAVDGNWGFFGCQGTTSANGITCADAVLFYAPLAQGPGNPNTFYYGSDRLYRSTNKGVNNTVVSQAPITAGAPISSIAISPQDDNYRLIGQSTGGLFYTTTGSSTLTNLDPTNIIPNRFVGRVMFDPSNKNTAYIALGGYMASTTTANSHVWKITNLDTTPVLTGMPGLPDAPVNAIAVDSTNGNRVYVGTDIGVYATTDGGVSWNPFGTGLPVVSVFDAKIQPSSGVLRIATHGRGMWEATPAPLVGGTNVAGIISGKTGAVPGSRNWTIQVSNQGPSPANSTQINGLTFSQIAGPLCVPTVTSPLPVFVGDIAAGANAGAGVAINFPAGCSSASRFTVNISLSANNGNATAITVRNNERP